MCLYFAHGLGVDEVLVAPDTGIIVVLPLQVDVEVGQVITLRYSEFLPHLVALFLSALTRTGQCVVIDSDIFNEGKRCRDVQVLFFVILRALKR